MQHPTAYAAQYANYAPAPPGGAVTSTSPPTAAQYFVRQPSDYVGNQAARPYDGYSKTHPTLPELYGNQVQVLQDLVTGFVLEAPIAVLQYLLPIQYDPTGAGSYEWDETVFSHVYAGETPPEAPPRLVTVKRTQHKARLRRIALAMNGEEGALSTEQGIADAQLRARGLSLVIVETIILSAIEKIVQAGDNQMLTSEVYIASHDPVDQAMLEADITGALQKGDSAMAHVLIRFQQELRVGEGTGSAMALLAPPDMMMHFLEPTESAIAAMGLERALIESNVFNASNTRIFNSMLVIQMPDIAGIAMTSDNPGVVAAAQSMSSETAFAEWNCMCFSSRGRTVYDGVHSRDRETILTTAHRDIWTYNANTDAVDRVSFATAVMACGIANQTFFDPSAVSPEDLAGPRRGAPLNMYMHALDGMQRVAVADFAGQLDHNVYAVEDMVVTAKQIQGKFVDVLGGGAGNLYARTHALLARLDSVAPFDTYAAALANENAPANTDQSGGGVFVGENPRDHPDADANGWAYTIQWKATEDGGMSIPSVKDVRNTAQGDRDIPDDGTAIPPFTACWTGMCALRNLHLTGTKGWNASVCREASELVEGWATLARCIDPAGANPLVNDVYRHPWQLKAQPGCALFGLAFGGRVPVYLPARTAAAAPSDVVLQEGDSGVVLGLPSYYDAAVGNGLSVDDFGGEVLSLRGLRVRDESDLYLDATVRALDRLDDATARRYAYLVARIYSSAPDVATNFADKLAGMTNSTARGLVDYVWSVLRISMSARIAGSFNAPSLLGGGEEPSRKAIVDALKDAYEARLTSKGLPQHMRTALAGMAERDASGPSVGKEAVYPVMPGGGRVPFEAIVSGAGVPGPEPRVSPNPKYFRTPFEVGPMQVKAILRNPVPYVLLGNPADGFKTPRTFTAGQPIPDDFLRIPEMRPLGRYHSARGDETYLHHQRIHSVTQASAEGAADGADRAGGYMLPGLMGDEHVAGVSELAAVLDRLVCQNLLDRVASIIRGSNAMLVVIMLALLGMRISGEEAVEACLENDVHLFWLNMFLLRPYLVYRCDSLIMMKPGTQTGKTILGHRNVMAGTNAALQNMLQSVVAYTGSFVTRPQNIRRLRNVRIAAYLGGGGTRIAHYADNVSDMLVGEPSAFPGYLAYPVGMAERDFQPFLPVAGAFPDQSIAKADSRGPQWSSASYYNKHVYGIDGRVNSPTRSVFHDDPNNLPFVAARGMQVNQGVRPSERAITAGKSWRGLVASCPGAASKSAGNKYYPSERDAREAIRASIF